MPVAKLIVKKRCLEATLPKRASAEAAGYDLTSAICCSIDPGQRRIVETGLSITVPPGTYGRVAPRSGLAVKHGINVLAGVIDRDYVGEVGVVLVNHSDQPFNVSVGDRIGQLILEQILTPEVEEVEELVATERGEGGFGSTGGHSLSPHAEASAVEVAQAASDEAQKPVVT